MNLKNKLISIFSLIILAGLLSLVPGVNKSSQQAQIISSLKQESIIEQTQIKLKELGYYSGEINNKFNIKTRLALIKYQKDNNIRQTGKLDRETQKLLLGIDLYGEKRESPNIVTGVLGGWVFEEFDEDLRIINYIHQYYIERPDGSIEIIPKEFYDHDHDDKKSPGGRLDYKGGEIELDYSIFLEENLGKEISLNKETKEFTLIEKSNERDSALRQGRSGYREGKAAVFLITFEEANIGNVNYNVQAQDQDPNGNILGGPPSNPPIRPAPEDVQSYLFDQDNGQFQKFYNEMSHGKVTYTGDVFGWYEMPGDGDDPEYQGSYGPCTIREAYANSAEHAIFEDRFQDILDYYSVDLSLYNTVIFLTECDEYGSIGGYASLVPIDIFGNDYHHIEIKGHPTRFSFTGPSDYVNFPDYVGILNHELGHTFGLPHANSFDCGTNVMSGNCSTIDYGSPFDRMGYPDGSSIFNFRAQKKVGWIDESQILNINQPGSYYVGNLQTENGVVAANISYPGTKYPIFSVEHRKADGFDSRLSTYSPLFEDVLNGLIVYKNFYRTSSLYSSPFKNLFDIANIVHFSVLDPNPTQDPIYEDLKYDAITDYFYEPFTGIGIIVTNVTPDGIYFDVDYDLQTPECNYDIPISQIFSDINIYYNALSFSTYFNENEDCLPKRYEISPADATSENFLTSNAYINTFPVNNGSISDHYVYFDQENVLSLYGPNDTYNINLEIKDLQTGENQIISSQGQISDCDISQVLDHELLIQEFDPSVNSFVGSPISLDMGYPVQITAPSSGEDWYQLRLSALLDPLPTHCGFSSIDIYTGEVSFVDGLPLYEFNQTYTITESITLSSLISIKVPWYISNGLRTINLTIYDISTGQPFNFQFQVEII